MYGAKIILDSVGPNGARITTLEFTLPRIVLAELNTHRMLARNSASSRAIPSATLLKRIEEDPMLPVWWGKNQSGMQAKEELPPEAIERVRERWLRGRDEMVRLAAELTDPDVGPLHKQIANRVVEPWMFTTVVCTATEWSNVRALRVDPDAQPEFERTMRFAFEAYDASDPVTLQSGEWHLPYVTGHDELLLRDEGYSDQDLCLISTGRCARVSYLTHDKKRDPAADLALARDRLIPSGHMSPLEHPCRAMSTEEWRDYARDLATAWIYNRVPVGNVWGWVQFRKTIEGEHDFSIAKAKRAMVVR